MADLTREIHFMAHDHQGHAAARQLPNYIQNLGDHFRVKCGRRLVEKHDFGSHCECPSYGDSLLLASRQLSRVGVHFIFQTDPGK